MRFLSTAPICTAPPRDCNSTSTTSGFLELFARKGVLVRAFYYTALAEEQEFSPLRPLIDWLDYNGFTVVTKPLKEYTDAQGRVA